MGNWLGRDFFKEPEENSLKQNRLAKVTLNALLQQWTTRKPIKSIRNRHSQRNNDFVRASVAENINRPLVEIHSKQVLVKPQHDVFHELMFLKQNDLIWIDVIYLKPLYFKRVTVCCTLWYVDVSIRNFFL